MSMSIKRRRLIIRLALVVVWIGVGVLLFVLNRGHAILVDNRNLESPGMRAPDLIKVTIDKGKPLEFFRGDRDIFDVGGGRHRVRVEFSDGTPPFEARFSLPLGPDMFILSIPKMISGIEPYFEVFRSQPEPRKVEEEEEIPEVLP
ncbi:hypothetical protein AGMMS50293_25650 [Spirochaetia bacterium]|nr:hypothetical protein AGMMS50293_25650 [Spirochaetia bacterium]